MTIRREELEQKLLVAHAEENSAELIRLYTLAGDRAEAEGDIDAACFYLTHAFVFALEAGSDQVMPLNKRLVSHGRAHPIPE